MSKNSPTIEDEMPAEYNFAGKEGVRGKHYRAFQRAFREGFTITIHEPDGSITLRQVPPESMISIAPDLRERFPDTETVDKALRSYLSILDFVEDNRKTA